MQVGRLTYSNILHQLFTERQKIVACLTTKYRYKILFTAEENGGV
jgi:hypothetical protein